MRTISVSDFLTETEMKYALGMYAETVADGRSDFAHRFADEVVRPNIQRINQQLGQQNDPLYLAYAVEAALQEAVHQVRSAKSEKAVRTKM